MPCIKKVFQNNKQKRKAIEEKIDVNISSGYTNILYDNSCMLTQTVNMLHTVGKYQQYI